MNITINANRNSNVTVINNESTLNELLSSLGNVIREEKTPTPKKLSEIGGTVVAKAEGCMAYSCGYAVYDNGSGRTVMWLPERTCGVPPAEKLWRKSARRSGVRW